MFGKIKKQLIRLITLPNRILTLHEETKENIDATKILLGKLLTVELLKRGTLEHIQDAEFSVFSQGGDDGIIQYLTHQVIGCPKMYVDIGGGNYTQPDTRFLLQNDYWKGYIIDKVESETIKRKEFYSIFDVQRIQAMVTAENVNDLFPQEDVGLLNLDIDGNDYYVLEALKSRPTIIAAEYNAYLGLHPITVPYNPAFDRTTSEFGTQYCGMSIGALYHLLTSRGYAFVGCNSIGINAYFVRTDALGTLKSVRLEEGYVEAKIKLHHVKGKQFISTRSEYVSRFFMNAPFYNVIDKKTYKGADLFT